MKEERVRLGREYVGFVLARDVYKERDMLLLGAGKVLTESIIDKLKKNGVEHVYIQTAQTKG